MKPYLLDTCTISDLFSGAGSVEQKLKAVPPTRVAISTVTILEILYGLALNEKARRRFAQPFKSLCGAIRVLPFDEPAAEAAARIRADLKSKGTPIGSFDLLIGATAVSNGCIIVTSNQREFARIDGIDVEDWR